MGPYSELKQSQRRQAILQVLTNTELSQDARRIWTQHLNRLATTESQYNARVQAVYSNWHKGSEL